jgi:hypothetical protein
MTTAAARQLRTEKVLSDVADHRLVQFATYGDNAGLEDGTGPEERWLYPLTSYSSPAIEDILRDEYNKHDVPTWMHLVREEVAEAFQESDPVRLREELIQVAALCVSWVEKLDARESISPKH